MMQNVHYGGENSSKVGSGITVCFAFGIVDDDYKIGLDSRFEAIFDGLTQGVSKSLRLMAAKSCMRGAPKKAAPGAQS